MNWLFFFFFRNVICICVCFSQPPHLYSMAFIFQAPGSENFQTTPWLLQLYTKGKQSLLLLCYLCLALLYPFFFFCILLSLSFIISPLTPRVLWGLTEEPFLNQRWINNIRILYDCLGMSVMCSEQRKIQGSSCLIKSSSIKIGKPNICSTNRLYLLPLACAIQ